MTNLRVVNCSALCTAIQGYEITKVLHISSYSYLFSVYFLITDDFLFIIPLIFIFLLTSRLDLSINIKFSANILFIWILIYSITLSAGLSGAFSLLLMKINNDYGEMQDGIFWFLITTFTATVPALLMLRLRCKSLGDLSQLHDSDHEFVREIRPLPNGNVFFVPGLGFPIKSLIAFNFVRAFLIRSLILLCYISLSLAIFILTNPGLITGFFKKSLHDFNYYEYMSIEIIIFMSLSFLLFLLFYISARAVRQLFRVFIENRHCSPEAKQILYLRSFYRDREKFKPPPQFSRWWFYCLMFGDSNLDRIILEECAETAPVFAAHAPGSTEVPYGPFRIQLDDKSWKLDIRRRISSSKKIVLALDDTPGTKWELDTILRTGSLSKTLIIRQHDSVLFSNFDQIFKYISSKYPECLTHISDRNLIGINIYSKGIVLFIGNDEQSSEFRGMVRAFIRL